MHFNKFLPPGLLPAFVAAQQSVVNQTTCNGQIYQYNQLAGYGYINGTSRDHFGDTIGGIGSGISIPRGTVTKLPNGEYVGIIWAQPDRGWNTQGTLNYQGRVHQFLFTFKPVTNTTTVADPSPPNVEVKYLNTILYTDTEFVPTTGLDANPHGGKNITGFPELPVATYTGDGFGGEGPGGNRVPVDHEGLVVHDGTIWTSDEYGPYIYKSGLFGRMIEAIQPPAAFLPMRNGSISFSADSPTAYSNETDDVSPTNPTTGRENNHGFEGLTVSPDGNDLYILMQAALDQDGGTSKSSERYPRLLHYDVSQSPPVYLHEYVVPLPLYPSGSKPNTAAQSEIHYISPAQFLVLSRDSDAGQCESSTQSLYRQADVFDITGATDIKGATYDCATCAVATNGVLNSTVTPATYCPFLDYNDNDQLGRFGLHNGGAMDSGLLNEKWESLALVPVIDGDAKEFFLFSMSDNDFITQDGYQNFGRYQYADASGCNLNSQVLVFQVTLPADSDPYVS